MSYRNKTFGRTFEERGYVGVKHQKGNDCFVLFASVNGDTQQELEPFVERFGGAITTLPTIKAAKDTQKPKGRRGRPKVPVATKPPKPIVYQWSVSGQGAYDLMAVSAPFVTTKRPQVQAALSFPVGMVGVAFNPDEEKDIREKRAEVYETLKRLNAAQWHLRRRRTPENRARVFPRLRAQLLALAEGKMPLPVKIESMHVATTDEAKALLEVLDKLPVAPVPFGDLVASQAPMAVVDISAVSPAMFSAPEAVQESTTAS